MVSYFLYGLVGAISGLHSSCWGGYKDSLYEKFKTYKYIRSIIFGFVLGILLFEFLKLNGVINPNLGVFFVFVMAFERLFTEAFKAFFRDEKQNKYKIPSKFHIFGKIIENKLLRLLMGLVFILVVFLLFYIPYFFKINLSSPLIIGLIWGVLAGLGSAAGGAWKDAPIEGFHPIKFFRSPLVSGLAGLVFSFFTNNYSFLLFACGGAERMIIEFYKTFITRHTPGKFKATKPLHKDWIKKRKRFIVPYLFTWVVFILLLFV